MYGAIIVEPVGGLPKVDKEFYVMQGEWYTSGKFGQKGHQAFDEAKALREKPEFFTFNGHATALKDHQAVASEGWRKYPPLFWQPRAQCGFQLPYHWRGV